MLLLGTYCCWCVQMMCSVQCAGRRVAWSMVKVAVAFFKFTFTLYADEMSFLSTVSYLPLASLNLFAFVELLSTSYLGV